MSKDASNVATITINKEGTLAKKVQSNWQKFEASVSGLAQKVWEGIPGLFIRGYKKQAVAYGEQKANADGAKEDAEKVKNPSWKAAILTVLSRTVSYMALAGVASAALLLPPLGGAAVSVLGTSAAAAVNASSITAIISSTVSQTMLGIGAAAGAVYGLFGAAKVKSALDTEARNAEAEATSEKTATPAVSAKKAVSPSPTPEKVQAPEPLPVVAPVIETKPAPSVPAVAAPVVVTPAVASAEAANTVQNTHDMLAAIHNLTQEFSELKNEFAQSKAQASSSSSMQQILAAGPSASHTEQVSTTTGQVSQGVA